MSRSRRKRCESLIQCSAGSNSSANRRVTNSRRSHTATTTQLPESTQRMAMSQSPPDTRSEKSRLSGLTRLTAAFYTRNETNESCQMVSLRTIRDVCAQDQIHFWYGNWRILSITLSQEAGIPPSQVSGHPSARRQTAGDSDALPRPGRESNDSSGEAVRSAQRHRRDESFRTRIERIKCDNYAWARGYSTRRLWTGKATVPGLNGPSSRHVLRKSECFVFRNCASPAMAVRTCFCPPAFGEPRGRCFNV